MANACSSLQIPSFLPSVKPHSRSLSIPAPFLLPRTPKTLPSFTLSGKHLPYAAISSSTTDGDGGDNPRAESTPKQCVFEHISLSCPSSYAFGRSVYESRQKFGEMLATSNPVDCDVVIPAHEFAYGAAISYAAKAGVSFQLGLINLAPVRAVLEGKRVVVVDDSIVRGTTWSKIVRMIREAGAKEVHMRIASPPIISSCYYGVDIPSSDELISNRKSVEEIREFIGADSLAFLPLEALREAMGSDSSSYCYACFSGPEGLM